MARGSPALDFGPAGGMSIAIACFPGWVPRAVSPNWLAGPLDGLRRAGGEAFGHCCANRLSLRFRER